MVSSPPYQPEMGGTIDIRGSDIVQVRIPGSPIREMLIDSNGRVYYLSYNDSLNDRRDVIMITLDEQQELRELHKKWCEDAVPIRELQGNEAFYDVGFRCGIVKQKKIPLGELPTILIRIIKTYPPA